MIARIVLLFLLLPAVEFMLFIQVERLISLWPTVALILVTGVVGGYLARREGASTWKKLNARLQTGALPGDEIVEGVIILVAGALLVTPGVLTDVVGFLGLVPPSRRVMRKIIMKRLQKKMEEGSMQVQYGSFYGGSGFAGFDDDPMNGAAGPSVGDADESDGPSGAEPDQWKGTGRQMPGHANEDDELSPDNGSRSDHSR
ncbi:MAG: FxsA family protein [Longimonas sp.]|uniref:FxsA family protein n=1 Tax=Longimonas sp. TaxID=2039626 RepID=UPI0033503C73